MLPLTTRLSNMMLVTVATAGPSSSRYCGKHKQSFEVMHLHALNNPPYDCAVAVACVPLRCPRRSRCCGKICWLQLLQVLLRAPAPLAAAATRPWALPHGCIAAAASVLAAPCCRLGLSSHCWLSTCMPRPAWRVLRGCSPALPLAALLSSMGTAERDGKEHGARKQLRTGFEPLVASDLGDV